jgi:hypothetical protein
MPLRSIEAEGNVSTVATYPLKMDPHTAYIPPRASQQKPDTERQFQVWDHVTVSLHTGRIVEATIKAVINRN